MCIRKALNVLVVMILVVSSGDIGLAQSPDNELIICCRTLFR